MKRPVTGGVCAALAFLCAAAHAQAQPARGGQTFPTKAIEFVVPANPGAGSDVFARVVADIIRKERLLAQPIVINNRPGGGGAVGAAYGAQKRGDPYTVVSFPTGMMLTAHLRSGLDIGLDKFQPLALLGFDINCIMVSADSPFKTMRELVDAAKNQPRKINVSIGSAGSSSHMLVWELERLTGARFNVVVMKSGAEAVTAVLGGHVHWTTGQLTDAMPHFNAGKMRVLAMAAQQRLPSLPALPTMKEQGVDIHVAAGRSFAAPAGIPPPAAAFLEELFERVYKSAEWQDYMARHHMEPVFMRGTELGRYLATRQPEFTRFMADLGLAEKK